MQSCEWIIYFNTLNVWKYIIHKVFFHIAVVVLSAISLRQENHVESKMLKGKTMTIMLRCMCCITDIIDMH